jgi:glycerate 2-kinase
MTIVVAPDKFKGTLSAIEVCSAIEEALHHVNPHWQVTSVPLADGGEGTSDILTKISGGRKALCKARDPLMREISTSFGISAKGDTAFIEMASASGLKWLSTHEQNPAYTSTVGTGDMIRIALDAGVRRIVLGIGGSATNDAGIGMAYALGAQFYNSSLEQIFPCGKNLSTLSRMDLSSIDPRVYSTEFVVLCDVDNPLYGQDGATYTYGLQKGARAEDLPMLDEGLKRVSLLARRDAGIELNFPGAGAAGGLGAGAKLFLRAKIVSGIGFMIDFAQLKEKIASADLVITGEGKLDRQTLSGKVISGISRLCMEVGRPVWVVAGQNELTKNELRALNISNLVVLMDGVTPQEQAFSHARDVLFEKILLALTQNFSKSTFE